MPTGQPRSRCRGAISRRSSARTSRGLSRRAFSSPRDGTRATTERKPSVLFFGLSTWLLALVLAVVMATATITGLVVGRTMSRRTEHLQEPFGVLQGALIGFMGLVLAFGL